MASNDCTTEPDTTPNTSNTQPGDKDSSSNEEKLNTKQCGEEEKESFLTDPSEDQSHPEEGSYEALYSQSDTQSGSDVEETVFDVKVDTPPQRHKDLSVETKENIPPSEIDGEKQSEASRLDIHCICESKPRLFSIQYI